MAPPRKPIRIWVDGCFDMMHYGHSNALRQAKSMGDFLVVGVHSDAEIEMHKGPTVMKEQERYDAVAACKWADQVVPNAPYFTTVEMLDKYNCDFCVHGDDVTTLADGTDCYAQVKSAGRYQECKRTQGVSTTELVGRMLLMTRDHLQPNQIDPSKGLDKQQLDIFSAVDSNQPSVTVSHFLPTTSRLLQFSNGAEPTPNSKIVYVDGGFDLFHVGHIQFLKAARDFATQKLTSNNGSPTSSPIYLVVGIHEDRVVNQVKGRNYPIMNLFERTLSVLSCLYVDEVIIGAPYSVGQSVLTNFHYPISMVIHGSTLIDLDQDGSDPYSLPKSKGIFHTIDSPRIGLSCESIVERILNQRKLYEARNRRKTEKALLEARLAEAAS